jgi:hypothetical protein
MQRHPYLIVAALLALSGCATGIQQETLYQDGAAPPPPPDTSRALVFGPTDEQAFVARNDPSHGRRPLYYGPNGHLYYEDGTAVQFKGVRHQLQDLRAEERISPAR